MKLKDLKVGDTVFTDAGFTCLTAGKYIVKESNGELYINCSGDTHYLDGQEDENGDLVGIFPNKYRLTIFTLNKGIVESVTSKDKTFYKDYKIVLQDVTSFENNCVELAYISGKNSYWNIVRKEKDVLTELGKTVNKFEKFFDIKAENFNLKKKITITEEWIKEDEI